MSNDKINVLFRVEMVATIKILNDTLMLGHHRVVSEKSGVDSGVDDFFDLNKRER